jgi:putative heme-binding domain-containing protein
MNILAAHHRRTSPSLQTLRSLALLSILASPAIGSEAGIDMAPGMSIRQVADDDLVPDCTTVAVDSEGSVIASGPGYIRRLRDSDGDGRFDQFTTIVDGPSHGAHGLCFDDGSLFYVGDNGVWQVGHADQAASSFPSPRRVLEIKTGGEHDAHALRKGPDGFWYLIAGNNTKGMFELQNSDRAVVPNPRAGAIWRISPDWSVREVWAHGFRNAFDFDFAPDHAIDTFDSDGERDVSLPWYRPTRVYRVRQGDDAGWLSRSWKRPNSDPLMPQVLAELGRGSPTGVLRYRHRRLPKRFHNGVFVLDWTFGKIVCVDDQGDTEIVAEASGTTGFAVTDIDALPDGSLVVSVGGRRSRGGLYLIDAAEPPAGRQSVEPATTVQEMWPEQRPARAATVTTDSIRQLRNRREPVIDQQAATHAVEILRETLREGGADREQMIAAMALFVESAGGLGPADPKDAWGKQQAAAVFDGYRSQLRPKLSAETIRVASEALLRIIRTESDDDGLVDEAIRTLAVIQPESQQVFAAVAADIDRVGSPIAKLHRLIALARIPVARSDEMTQQVVMAMLEIPVLVHESNLKIDRNWTPRLGELFVALEHRDSLLPSRLVADPGFGHPAHLTWTERMDPENLERARHKWVSEARGAEIDPAIARFVALGDDAVPRPVIHRWLESAETRSAAWLAISRHPNAADVETLRRAALSVDKVVREAAERALMRLGAEIPPRQSNSATTQQWMKKMETLITLAGNPAVGTELFVRRQCAVCHSGAKALGPPLEGINKRFSLQDLFRATVDPSHTISDRYRAKQVLTTDDHVVVGMTIYENVDGVTLLTADAKTVRINADSIAAIKEMATSLMPEGLLDGLSDQQVADLMAYMRAL